MKYVFDTTAYSELVRGNEAIAKLLLAATSVLIPNVVMAELQYGFQLGSKQQVNEQLLSRFVASRKVSIVLPDNATTNYFVEIAIFACKRGVQLSSHDIWIAALAEQWDAVLVTFDQDFRNLGHKRLELQF